MKSQSWVNKNGRWILITPETQSLITPGSIVATKDQQGIHYYLIHFLLPKKYSPDWIPSNTSPSLEAYEVIQNPYLRPYFEEFLKSNELSGFFHHIGHFFKHLGKGIVHFFKNVVKHPLKTIPIVVASVAAPYALAAAATAIPGAAAAAGTVGGAIESVGIPASVVHVAGEAAVLASKEVVSSAAANVVGKALNKAPRQMASEGAQALGYPPKAIPGVVQSVQQKVQNYATEKKVPTAIPYQQTLAYVTTHMQDFIKAGYKTPMAATVDILYKRNGVPPAPSEPVANVINSGNEYIKPLIYSTLAVLAVIILTQK